MAVRDGRVLALGDAEVVLTHRGPNTTFRKLGSDIAYPGFIDVHNHHAVAGSTDLYELSFSSGLGLDEILDRIRAYADDMPSDAWITGGSWGSTLLDRREVVVVSDGQNAARAAQL